MRFSPFTYALVAVAVRKACAICQSCNRSWEMITAGWKTPDATNDAPKAAPVRTVGTALMLMFEGALEGLLDVRGGEGRNGVVYTYLLYVLATQLGHHISATSVSWNISISLTQVTKFLLVTGYFRHCGPRLHNLTMSRIRGLGSI